MLNPNINLIFTPYNITTAARELWQYGKAYSVWAFHAPMGAGKTTLISTLCNDILQVKETVSSPTFAIINEYQSLVAGIVYHMDWYRLKGDEEAVMAGAEDCLLSGNLCLVEWPEVAPSLLPYNTLHIFIEITGETSRSLTIT